MTLIESIAKELRIPEGYHWIVEHPRDSGEHAALFKANEDHYTNEVVVHFAMIQQLTTNLITTISPGIHMVHDLNDPSSINDIQNDLDRALNV